MYESPLIAKAMCRSDVRWQESTEADSRRCFTHRYAEAVPAQVIACLDASMTGTLDSFEVFVKVCNQHSLDNRSDASSFPTGLPATNVCVHDHESKQSGMTKYNMRNEKTLSG